MKIKGNNTNKLKKNGLKNTFYKGGPYGISLIVLVITIIVIIILATAIIVILLGNNPIEEANRARYESDRDSMQSIFTNTVAKVMAQNQSTIDIQAGALNEVTSGVSSSIGNAYYTVHNSVKSENKNGTIIFDNKENTETEYYTGRKLPIYKSGETTWYVDEEGIISLKVNNTIYGEGNVNEKLNENIKINANSTVNSEFSKATIEVIVEYDGQIESVTINGEKIEVVKNQEGKYVGRVEVNNNGIYNIVARAKDGSLNKTNIKIESLTENMEIWNKADMESFRDKVNEGKSFEGKTVKVMDNIDLENVPWEPIGSNGKVFKGEFIGNYHVIRNLYINNSKDYQALFATSSNAKITGVILENINIKAREYVAGLLAYGENVIIEECGINGSSIESTFNNCGGISAKINGGTVSKCYNNTNVTLKTTENIVWVGGILGIGNNNVKIINCYNAKDIYVSSKGATTGQLGARSAGIVGSTNNTSIEFCYNLGMITSSGVVIEPGGIVGWASTGTNINSCFNVGKIVGESQASDTSLHRKGEIVGAASSSVNIKNCYYSANKMCGINIGNNPFENNILDTQANIKSKAIQILGNNSQIWIQAELENNGWPLLKWQNSN